jgi:hypothetical protein
LSFLQGRKLMDGMLPVTELTVLAYRTKSNRLAILIILLRILRQMNE